MLRHIFSVIAGKLTSMATTIFVASLVCFAAIELPAGDYLSTYRAELQQAQVDSMSIETVLRYLDERFALSQPIYVRYVTWISGLASGDLGYSLLMRRSVNDLIAPRLSNSLILAFATLVYMLVVGVGIGVFAAIRPYSLWDNVLTLLVFLALAVPNFILAVSFLYLWITVFGGIPQFGFHSTEYVFRTLVVGQSSSTCWRTCGCPWSSSALGRGRHGAVVPGPHARGDAEPYIQTARMKGGRTLGDHVARPAGRHQPGDLGHGASPAGNGWR